MNDKNNIEIENNLLDERWFNIIKIWKEHIFTYDIIKTIFILKMNIGKIKELRWYTMVFAKLS